MAIRDVTLRNGPATLIEMIDETGRVEGVNVIRNIADRLFFVGRQA